MTFNKIFYVAVRLFFKILFILYNRLSIRWTEPIPKGKVIVASNHCSNLDPVLVGAAFPRPLCYFAKEELFRPFLFGRIIRILGALPVSRSDNASAAGALKAFLKILEEGSDVLIFPEGSRSPDGNLLPLEGGVGLIAAHSKVPILPVYVKGSFKAMPTGSPFIRPTKLTVTFGKPLSFDSEFLKTKGAREKIVEELTNSMRALEASCS